MRRHSGTGSDATQFENQDKPQSTDAPIYTDRPLLYAVCCARDGCRRSDFDFFLRRLDVAPEFRRALQPSAEWDDLRRRWKHSRSEAVAAHSLVERVA